MSYVWNVPTKVLFGAGMVKELAKEKMPGKKGFAGYFQRKICKKQR